jgi:putative ATPase
VRQASEDIGLADPNALTQVIAAKEAYQFLGSPEGELAIAQAVVFLSCAAKSNAVYLAINEAMNDAKSMGSLEVPKHLRNAPTRLMKQLGHGEGYRYAHNEPDGHVRGENYFPEGMRTKAYYRPVSRGLEIKIAEILTKLRGGQT